jgi:hypothetical protein
MAIKLLEYYKLQYNKILLVPCIFKVKGRITALNLNITLAFYLMLRWSLTLNKNGIS